MRLAPLDEEEQGKLAPTFDSLLTDDELQTLSEIHNPLIQSPLTLGLSPVDEAYAMGLYDAINTTPHQSAPDSGNMVTGALNSAASIPDVVGSLAIAIGEIGGTQPEARGRRIIPYIQQILEGGLFQAPQAAAGFMSSEVKTAIAENMGQETSSFLIGAGKAMKEHNYAARKSLGLLGSGFWYDTGNTAGSMIGTVGMTMITKSPKLSAAWMFSDQFAATYDELRDADVSPDDAFTKSFQNAAGSAMIEGIGGGVMLHSAAKSPKLLSVAKSIAIKAAGQGWEEGSQQTLEEWLLAPYRDTTFIEKAQNVMMASTIGAIFGVPLAGMAHLMERQAAKEGLNAAQTKLLVEAGLDNNEQLAQSAGEWLSLEDGSLSIGKSDVAEIEKLTKAFEMSKSGTETSDPLVAAMAIAHNPSTSSEVRKAVRDLVLGGNFTMEQLQGASNANDGALSNKTETGVAVENYYKNNYEVIKARDYSPEVHGSAVILEDGTVISGNKIVHEELASKAYEAAGVKLEKGKESSVAMLSDTGAVRISGFADEAAPLVFDSRTGFTDKQAQMVREIVKRNPNRKLEFWDKESNAGSNIQQFNEYMRNQKQNNSSTETAQPDPQAESDYAKVAAQTEASTLGEDTRNILSDVKSVSADMFVPVSTRLGKIDQKIKHAVRKYLFQNSLYNLNDKKIIKPFVEKISDMSEADYRVLDLALKNRDQGKIDELLGKYNIADDFQAVRQTLDDLYNEAKEVGLDMNYLSDYFPRVVKKSKVLDYMAAIRGKEEWTLIEAALLDADPNGVFTTEEQAEFVDNFLRGFNSNRIMLAKGGFTKQRSVDYVTPEFNQFYESSSQALVKYVDAIRHGIEARRLFGKGDAEASIGTYVSSLVNEGSIKQDQVEELKAILKAIVEPQGTRGVVSWAKNVTYIYVMGSPVSAITQIQDLSFSLAFNGYYRTGKALTKALVGKSEITQKDIGLDNILQEFSDESRAGNAVRKVFKAVGLSYIDNIGSQTYMNAALDRLRSQAKKNKKAFNKEMDIIFGEDAEQVKQELASGEMTENVQYLAYSELLDVQPKALSEMPLSYLRGGNGRIFYMLKSYTIKQIDIYRRKIFDEIASGEKDRMIAGTQNLVRLSSALMLMGMTADALKDLLLGREIEPDELVLDNLLKLTGLTKYQIYKSRQDGIMKTFWKTLFVPPVGSPVDDVVKDIRQISEGDKEIKDAEVAKGVPVAGKLYYWWLGGGADKD